MVFLHVRALLVTSPCYELWVILPGKVCSNADVQKVAKMSAREPSFTSQFDSGTALKALTGPPKHVSKSVNVDVGIGPRVKKKKCLVFSDKRSCFKTTKKPRLDPATKTQL